MLIRGWDLQSNSSGQVHTVAPIIGRDMPELTFLNQRPKIR